jgi:hypothetical protein
MRAASLRAASLSAVLIVLATGPALTEPCTRDAFEQVVDEASSTLVSMTQKNTPTFQAKLRALRDKRQWTQDQLVKEGAPFVQDPTIAAFDEASQQLLIKINAQDTGTADCRLLGDLKATMAKLVDTQTAKWTYMFGKIDQELAK